MNIAITTHNSYYFRPDTTLNREGNNYYCPNDVSELLLTPCIYTKALKPGKAINAKFINRYIDCFDFGLIIDAKEVDMGIATSMDFTTIFQCNFKELSEITNAVFELKINNEVVFNKTNIEPSLLYNAVTFVSSKSSFRHGDLIAVKLSEPFTIKVGDNIVFNQKEINIL